MATWESEFTTPGTSARVWLVLQVDLVSQNIANNTSTLNWYLRMEERVNASPYRNYSDCVAAATVNNAVYSAGNLNYNFNATNQTIGVASGTITVTHNADGTLTIPVSASYDGKTPLGTASISSSLTLTTIPRATTPTVSPTSGSTGSTFTIGHTPAASSFYHDVAYSLDGGATYTNIQVGVVGTDTSTDWTPAHSLLPDVTSATAIIRLITRASAGGTIIGTKTVNLPLTVPSSVKPTVSSVAWEDAQTSGPDIPTLMGGAGRFVQRWSKLKPTVTSAGAGGSSVTGATVTQAGQTTDSGTAFANPVNSSGAVPYAAIATDTRGRASDPFYDTVAVKAYNFPNLPTPAIARTSDAGGASPSPTGTYLRITPAASVSSLNFGDGEKNLLEWRVRTRLKGASSWTTEQDWTTATVSGNTWTTPKVIGGYAASNEYEVEVSIRDLFGKNGFDTGNTIKTLTINVPSESVFMDWNEGQGVGFGRYHTDGGPRVQVAGGLDADALTQGGVPVVAADATSADPGSVPTWDGTDWSVEPVSGVPAGTIIAWVASAIPDGWLECDGQAVSRTTYSDLFAIIGVGYGSGDGSTTFNVPDFRGRVVVGLDTGDSDFDSFGDIGGEKAHQLTTDEMPSHTHIQNAHNHPSTGHAYFNDVGWAAGRPTAYLMSNNNFPIASGNATATNQNTGGDDPHNNLQPYGVAKYIIKASGGIGALTSTVESVLLGRVADVEQWQDEVQAVSGANRPSFQATGTSTVSKSGAQSYTTLVLGVERFDQTGDYDASTGQFTAPVAGVYVFSISTVQTGVATGPEIALYKNGSMLYGNLGIGYEVDYQTFGATVFAVLEEGDVIEVRWQNNNSTTVTIDRTRSQFGGALLG